MPASIVIVSSVLSLLPAAGPELASPFQDHMVLQRGMPVPVFGTATPGADVTVSLGGQKQSTQAQADGRWIAKLSALDAGGPLEMTVAADGVTVTIRDVLVGEVWVCSGQSNMEWQVSAAMNAKEETAVATLPRIRMFTCAKSVAATPQRTVAGQWVACAPSTVGNFSAVGFYFGRELHRKLDVPIGLIHTSWGGTPAESWTTIETLKSDADYTAILDRYEQQAAAFPGAMQTYQAQLAQWQRDADAAKASGKAEPQKPNPPPDASQSPWRPASLYQGMIAPLVPYAIRGAIWYQGESNADRAEQYRKLFPAMIKDWRRAWGQGDFPFLFVQLANFMKQVDAPGESAWAELREAQSMTLALANTGMAVAIDIGDANDIHPRNKQEVGRRLALAALAPTYGAQIEFSGPRYESMKVEGDQIRVRFTHVGGGLIASDGHQLTGFAIAGEDRRFVWADAEIDGDCVVVASEQVPKPVAVRYAWSDNPRCSLANRDGLPASPFRTDDWPGVTAGKR